MDDSAGRQQLPRAWSATGQVPHDVVEHLGVADQRFVAHALVLRKVDGVGSLGPDFRQAQLWRKDLERKSSNARSGTRLPATCTISAPAVIVEM